MITFGERTSGTAFYDAARQGWKEITKVEVPDNHKIGEDIWDVFQRQAERHRYSETRVGLAFRAGRCGFHAFLDMTGEEIGLRTADFRLHPVKKRLAIGFDLLTRLVQQSGFKQLHVDTKAGYSVQFGHPVSEVQRGYLMGFFQEFFEWASQGRVYPLIQKDIRGFCFATEPLNL